MKYKEFSKILTKQMQVVRKCKGYPEFKEDIAILRKYRKNYGKPSILAYFWMKEICNMSKPKLTKYVENYKKGMLDPFQFEPKKRKLDEENGFMDENDDYSGIVF